MAELINLNRARKRSDKEEKSRLADMNRLKFGRTKLERQQAASDNSRAAKILDQHQILKGDAT